MARISSGSNSKQDYQTPKALIEACEKRFGKITVDLAAHKDNKVCPRYITTEELWTTEAFGADTFKFRWHKLTEEFGGVLWLNPPFGEIPKFSKKCAEEAELGANVLLLIPYGTTKAFMSNVLGESDIYMLEGRLQFIPGKSFPKDCVVVHYYKNATGSIYFWDWRNDRISNSFVCLNKALDDYKNMQKQLAQTAQEFSYFQIPLNKEA